MMEVIWLRLARQDIEEINDYYTEVAGKEIANSIVSKIVKSTRLLTQQPYIGHISPLDDKGLILEWAIPSTNYILPYSVVGDEIHIYRVFDSRQQPVDS